jgi:aspartyl-tRNA(Asn)/glutamyl-tRNA(Gln) amidotransferase subunit A
MVLGALGTQTGGSIARPAAFCGACGLKPTFGRLPTEGILPFALSLDHPGPMARTTADLALLWRVLAGTDPRDVAERAPDAPIRLGRLRGPFEDRAEPAMREALDAGVDRLRGARMAVEDAEPGLDFEGILADHRLIMAAEAAGVHELWLSEHPDDYPPRIRALVDEGLALPAAPYARARGRQARLYQAMRERFAGLDAFVTPSAVGPAPGPETTGDPVMNSPWSFLGLPTVTLPIGLSPEALPLGMQLVGNYYAEAPLLAVAQLCEAALRSA